ncbi:MAG: undecaprenyl-diphosphate phosphatase [Rhabdochlamydiaceae bacterium]
MNIFQAVLLGLIQGLTEFFPVSSSTHLKLTQYLMGVKPTLNLLFFDLSCHLGTLIALFIHFRKDIADLLLTKEKGKYLYLISLVPLPFFYFILREVRLSFYSLHFSGFFLIITAAFLFLSDKIQFPSEKNKKMNEKKRFFIIGCFQSLALLPGISRSGATISAALMLKYKKQEAIKISFILCIPITLLGILSQIGDTHSFLDPTINWLNCLVGLTVAALSGLCIIRFAMKQLALQGLRYCTYYCLLIGILITIYFNFVI